MGLPSYPDTLLASCHTNPNASVVLSCWPKCMTKVHYSVFPDQCLTQCVRRAHAMPSHPTTTVIQRTSSNGLGMRRTPRPLRALHAHHRTPLPLPPRNRRSHRLLPLEPIKHTPLPRFLHRHRHHLLTHPLLQFPLQLTSWTYTSTPDSRRRRHRHTPTRGLRRRNRLRHLDIGEGLLVCVVLDALALDALRLAGEEETCWFDAGACEWAGGCRAGFAADGCVGEVVVVFCLGVVGGVFVLAEDFLAAAGV